MNSSQTKTGSAPGSLIFVGERKMDNTRIDYIQYADTSFEEEQIDEIETIFDKLQPEHKTWVNIDGVHDVKLIEKVGTKLNLDPLLLEDILDTTQRAKGEVYGDHLYMVLRMIRYDDEQDVTMSEQFSVVLGPHYLFTFQEVHGDILNSVRNRLRRPKTKIRSRSMDYLAYALIDTIVDHYISAIEQFGERIELLDQKVLSNPGKEVLEEINYYKREINYLRKVIRPVKELLIQFEKSDFLSEENEAFLKDLQDHTSDAIEAIEVYRELLSDLLNIYHTSMSNKLNEIIQLLTIYSVIFIPLTFLAGIYGMNFKFFPELDYPYAYPIFWGVLITITISMIIYFRRKKWL